MAPFPSTLTPLNLFLVQLRPEGGASCHRVSAKQGLLAELIGCRSWNIQTSHDTHHPGLLCILWMFSSNKAKHHEKASGHCTGAFVCPGLLWVGAAPQGNLKEWAASLLLKEEEELTSPADFPSLSFMGLGMYFPGFAGSLWPSPVTVSFLFIRCARGGCGAESSSPESPGGSQLYAVV